MKTRTGSTTLASVLGIAGLLAAGFGAFGAYKSFMGCGACCAGHNDNTVVATPAVAEKTDSCCALGGGKAIPASDTAKADGACCKDKAASECCKTEGKAASCEGKATECHGEAAEKPAEPAPATPANDPA